MEAKRHMLDAYPAPRKMYDENDDNTIVLYFPVLQERDGPL